jgi:hypothetical protein
MEGVAAAKGIDLTTGKRFEQTVMTGAGPVSFDEYFKKAFPAMEYGERTDWFKTISEAPYRKVADANKKQSVDRAYQVVIDESTGMAQDYYLYAGGKRVPVGDAYLDEETWKRIQEALRLQAIERGKGKFHDAGGGYGGERGWYDRYGYSPPAFAAYGIVPGARGTPVPMIGHGGERFYSGDSRASDPLLSEVIRIREILETRMLADPVVPAQAQPVAASGSSSSGIPVSEGAVVRGLVKVLGKHGLDLPAMREEIRGMGVRTGSSGGRYGIRFRDEEEDE